MLRSPVVVLVLALTLAACPVVAPDETGSNSSSGPGDTSTWPASPGDAVTGSSTGDAATGDAATGATTGSDMSTSSTGDSSTGSSSTTGGPFCGDGVVNGLETCDDGQETLLCDSDCTARACGDALVNAAAGEACDDGNVDDTDACLVGCIAATCGDGKIQAGVEDCDDGNRAPLDGCDAACLVHARWEHAGIATDVPLADLHQWTQCYAAPYAAGGTIAAVTKACTGDHLMMACRAVGSPLLTLAAHAPRADVFYLPEVKYYNGDRHDANGVGWYWAPTSKIMGFAPIGNKTSCLNAGQDNQLCWYGLINQSFDSAGRCGSTIAIDAEAKAWERVMFHAFD